MSRAGREMRRLTFAVSLLVLLLILAIVAYFLVDVTVTTDRNISHNRQRMIQESVRTLEETQSILILSKFDPSYMQIFNQDVVKRILGGDLDSLYRFAVQVATAFYPVDYVSIIKDGKVVSYGARSGLEVDPSQMPVTPPGEGYQVLDRLGDKEGFFVSVFNLVDLSVFGLEKGSIYANLVMDRTEEVADIEDYFRDQRNGFLLRLFIAAGIAILLSLLLTTTGLRHFTRKYVVDPIERLNRQAQEIMEGTFQGEVEVDERSAYAALQGLLRSGQKVLRRMEKELG